MVNFIALINPVLCGSILFNGGMATKTLRIFSSIGVAVPAYSTYTKYQRTHLLGVS